MNFGDLSWVTLQLTVSPSVLASSPSVTLHQISAEVRQLRSWCHGSSSLTGGRVCLLYPTLYWSLLHLNLYWSLLCLILSGVFFTWPSAGVFFTLSEFPCSTLYWRFFHLTLSGVSLLDPVLESFSRDLLWSLLHLTLSEVSLLDPLLESFSLDPLWSLLVWVWVWVTCSWQSVSQSDGRSASFSDLYLNVFIPNYKMQQWSPHTGFRPKTCGVRLQNEYVSNLTYEEK